MTICIAALAEDKKKLIAVADKMLSLSNPVPYQFEPDDLSKIYHLDDCAIVMAAGNTLFCDEISKLAVTKVSGSDDKSRAKVVELVLDAYHEIRRNLIVNTVLKSRNMTYEEYQEKQQSLHDSVVKVVEDAFTATNLGVDLIVAGCDNGDCYIEVIQHPGGSISLDIVGYACIGVGAPHAQIHMIESNYQKKLKINEVEKMVTDAKKKSEYAPGVGKKTDTVILPREVKSGTAKQSQSS